MRGWVFLGILLFAISVSATPPVEPVSATAVTPHAVPEVKLATNPPAIPHEPPIQVFNAPDGSLIVWATDGHGGVVLSVMDKSKHELASEGHYPEDRPGGFSFKQGGWTPDSQFFVYSASAWRDSGHNPSDMPIYAYSRAKNAFFDLGGNIGKHVGMVKLGKFSLSFPDAVELEVVDSKTHSDTMIDVHLAQFIASAMPAAR